jgi:hypothetical protein
VTPRNRCNSLARYFGQFRIVLQFNSSFCSFLSLACPYASIGHLLVAGRTRTQRSWRTVLPYTLFRKDKELLFSLPPIRYHYSRTADSLGQVHRTETNKWHMSHKSLFRSCDSETFFGILQHRLHCHWGERSDLVPDIFLLRYLGYGYLQSCRCLLQVKFRVHDSPMKPFESRVFL